MPYSRGSDPFDRFLVRDDHERLVRFVLNVVEAAITLFRPPAKAPRRASDEPVTPTAGDVSQAA